MVGSHCSGNFGEASEGRITEEMELKRHPVFVRRGSVPFHRQQWAGYLETQVSVLNFPLAACVTLSKPFCLSRFHLLLQLSDSLCAVYGLPQH